MPLTLSALLAQGTGGDPDIFGKVSPPPGIQAYNELAGGLPGSIGIVIFFSRLLRLATIAAGLFVLLNVIVAGYIYLSSSGDANAHTKARDQIMYSGIGLILIVVSYAAAILVGAIFFGNPEFIINPTICGPEGC